MDAEYRKTTRPAPMRTSPMMIIVPRRPRLRFGPIRPADNLETPRSARPGFAEGGLKVFWSGREAHASLGPAPRLEVVADPHALHLRVLTRRLEAHLPPHAAHLHPTERRGRIDEFVGIDPHHPGSELGRDAIGGSPMRRDRMRGRNASRNSSHTDSCKRIRDPAMHACP